MRYTCPGWNTLWRGRLACSVASILVSLMSHGTPYCIGLGEFHSSLGQANVVATTSRRISSDFILYNIAAVLAVYSVNSCMGENVEGAILATLYTYRQLVGKHVATHVYYYYRATSY